MNLYLLSQSYRTGYDTYSSAVVVAASPEAAVLIHPNGNELNTEDYTWPSSYKVEEIEAEFVGLAAKGYEEGTVICSSFKAG